MLEKTTNEQEVLTMKVLVKDGFKEVEGSNSIGVTENKIESSSKKGGMMQSGEIETTKTKTKAD